MIFIFIFICIDNVDILGLQGSQKNLTIEKIKGCSNPIKVH